MKGEAKYLLVFSFLILIIIFSHKQFYYDGMYASVLSLNLLKKQEKSYDEQTKMEVIDDFIQTYTIDWNHKLQQCPWELAASWASTKELYPADALELGKLIYLAKL